MGSFTSTTHGHSNLITPPDFIETVLILNATDDQIHFRHHGLHAGFGSDRYRRNEDKPNKGEKVAGHNA